MKKAIITVRNLLLVVSLMAASLSAIFFAAPVKAVGGYTEETCNCGEADQITNVECGTICVDPDNDSCLFGTDPNDPTKKCLVNRIIDTALFLIGAVSVVMLIYGGVRYTVSGGDSTAVGNAKNTILYAIVGIVVAILAYAIVNFVIARLV